MESADVPCVGADAVNVSGKEGDRRSLMVDTRVGCFGCGCGDPEMFGVAIDS